MTVLWRRNVGEMQGGKMRRVGKANFTLFSPNCDLRFSVPLGFGVHEIRCEDLPPLYGKYVPLRHSTCSSSCRKLNDVGAMLHFCKPFCKCCQAERTAVSWLRCPG